MYGIEQMGAIVEDFYNLRHGFRGRNISYRLQDYADALPVRGDDAAPIAIRW